MSDSKALPRFGPAGLSASYAKAGYKNALGAVEYTVSLGLDAFEYQSGHGVRISASTAASLAADAREAGLTFSMHAPYYISMSGLEEEKRLGSLRYFLESARAVRALGGNRVIFHAGSAAKQSREDALARAKDTLLRARQLLDDEGLEEVHLCPETMGKENQLGNLEEVLSLCQLDRRHIPCIDFGHLNARTQGALRTQADFSAILDRLRETLDEWRAANFHIHFSQIEYTKSGEKRHLTFEDTQYGPNYRYLLNLIYERGLSPILICESSGTQAEDARTMKQYYDALAGSEQGTME